MYVPYHFWRGILRTSPVMSILLDSCPHSCTEHGRPRRDAQRRRDWNRLLNRIDARLVQHQVIKPSRR